MLRISWKTNFCSKISQLDWIYSSWCRLGFFFLREVVVVISVSRLDSQAKGFWVGNRRWRARSALGLLLIYVRWLRRSFLTDVPIVSPLLPRSHRYFNRKGFFPPFSRLVSSFFFWGFRDSYVEKRAVICGIDSHIERIGSTWESIYARIGNFKGLLKRAVKKKFGFRVLKRFS